jgi:hypothetical protein
MIRAAIFAVLLLCPGCALFDAAVIKHELTRSR